MGFRQNTSLKFVKKCFCPIQKKIVVLETLSNVLNIKKKKKNLRQLKSVFGQFSIFQENHYDLSIWQARHIDRFLRFLRFSRFRDFRDFSDF